MHIAILADIHGNLTALYAVLADLRQQKPDVIYHGGDLAYGGANPSEVIDCIVQEGWKGVLGNTDEMLWDASARPALEASAPKLKPLFKVLFDLSGPATKQMIGPSRLAWLRALPTELRHENLALTHAGLAICGALPWTRQMMPNWRLLTSRWMLRSWFTATFTGHSFARSET